MSKKLLDQIIATRNYIAKNGTHGRSVAEVTGYVGAYMFAPGHGKQLESRAERFDKAGFVDCNDHIDYFKSGDEYHVVFVD